MLLTQLRVKATVKWLKRSIQQIIHSLPPDISDSCFKWSQVSCDACACIYNLLIWPLHDIPPSHHSPHLLLNAQTGLNHQSYRGQIKIWLHWWDTWKSGRENATDVCAAPFQTSAPVTTFSALTSHLYSSKRSHVGVAVNGLRVLGFLPQTDELKEERQWPPSCHRHGWGLVEEGNVQLYLNRLLLLLIGPFRLTND